jgi:hypothetical protein
VFFTPNESYVRTKSLFVPNVRDLCTLKDQFSTKKSAAIPTTATTTTTAICIVWRASQGQDQFNQCTVRLCHLKVPNPWVYPHLWKILPFPSLLGVMSLRCPP